MYKNRPSQSTNNKTPLINLSSDSDSQSDHNQENRHHIQQNTHKTSNPHHYQPPSHPYQPLTHKNINVNASSYKQSHCQFSTLSLDEASLIDFDSHVKSLTNQNQILYKENQGLKKINRELNSQMQSVRVRMQQISRNEGRVEAWHMQMQKLREKNKKLQQQLKRMQKKCENLSINQQLPNRKNHHLLYQQDINKVQAEMHNKLKQICNQYLAELSQQKMTIQLQSIITDFINSIITTTTTNTNTHTSNTSHEQTNTFSQYNSSQGNKNNMMSRGNRVNRSQKQTKANISNDYRLLQKSIESLKKMQRQIDQKSGSYLKREHQNDNGFSKSVFLDTSSISIVDRSKSKRKRIFQ